MCEYSIACAKLKSTSLSTLTCTRANPFSGSSKDAHVQKALLTLQCLLAQGLCLQTISYNSVPGLICSAWKAQLGFRWSHKCPRGQRQWGGWGSFSNLCMQGFIKKGNRGWKRREVPLPAGLEVATSSLDTERPISVFFVKSSNH